jgi:pimeloyl-ACP methyl ester carboxylesterase
MMKWLLIVASLLTFGLAGSWLWAGRDLKPLDDAARANAPGQFAELDAGRIHYSLTGPENAPLIVMVHGYLTPGFIFDQNAAALRAAGFRVLQFDHFGRGWSDRPSARYDADFYDAQLVALLDALGVDQPAGFVGLSMGGPIVAEFAARHPERVTRVFLFVPAGFDVVGADGTQAALIRTPLIGDWVWRMVAMKSIAGDPQYDETGLAPDSRLQGDVREQMAYRGYGRALLSTFRHFPMRGRDATFRALDATGIPVAAVFGTADPTVLIASAGQLAAVVTDAEIHILDGADHGLNYKRHAEVNPLLTDWFLIDVGDDTVIGQLDRP